MADLMSLQGRRIAGVRRVFYVAPDATIDPTDGYLEFTFDDGGVASFDVHLEESLVLLEEAWTDPFAPPLSPENEQFVAKYGKHELFDVTSEAREKGLFGEIIDVSLTFEFPDTPTAARLTTERAVLDVEVGADILIVHFGQGELLYPSSVKERLVIPDWYSRHVAAH